MNQGGAMSAAELKFLIVDDLLESLGF